MQQIKETATAETKTVEVARDLVKDSGRVRFGTGCIHFSDWTPAREAAKDAGSVR